MALPLLMLGAAALSAIIVQELADDRADKLRQRKCNNKVETLAHLAKYDSPIATYPSDLLASISNDMGVYLLSFNKII